MYEVRGRRCSWYWPQAPHLQLYSTNKLQKSGMGSQGLRPSSKSHFYKGVSSVPLLLLKLTAIAESGAAARSLYFGIIFCMQSKSSMSFQHPVTYVCLASIMLVPLWWNIRYSYRLSLLPPYVNLVRSSMSSCGHGLTVVNR